LFFFFSLSLYSRARILYAYAGFSYSHAGFPYTHAGVLYSLARFCCALLLLACRRPVFTCARLVLARKRPLLACALLLLACSRQLAPTVATADFVRTRDGRTRSFVHAAVARLGPVPPCRSTRRFLRSLYTEKGKWMRWGEEAEEEGTWGCVIKFLMRASGISLGASLVGLVQQRHRENLIVRQSGRQEERRRKTPRQALRRVQNLRAVSYLLCSFDILGREVAGAVEATNF